jgi:hypothetical protein
MSGFLEYCDRLPAEAVVRIAIDVAGFELGLTGKSLGSVAGSGTFIAPALPGVNFGGVQSLQPCSWRTLQ